MKREITVVNFQLVGALKFENRSGILPMDFISYLNK